MQMAKETDMFERLARCRRVLGGMDETGKKAHSSMFDPDVISFAHGEGVRRPHHTVVAAGVKALLDTEESSLDNYLFLQRIPELDQLIVERFIEEGIDPVTASQICLDSGTTRLFMAYLHAVAEKGDIFLVAPTFYHSLAGWCQIAGVKLVCVPTQRKNEYKLTVQDLHHWYAENVENCGGKRPKGIFLFNPTQTGAIYSQSEFKALAQFITQNDLIVLEDAIFMETEFEENAIRTHLAAVEGMADKVVTLNGASKAHNLANIRVGWGCGPKAVIDKMNSYSTATSATMPQVSKLMALAALKAPRAYLRANAAECEKRARLIIDLVAHANRLIAREVPWYFGDSFIRIEHEPKAGHSILLSFNKLKGMRLNEGSVIEDSVDLARYFLDEAKVAFSPGASSGFDNCVLRLSFGCVGLKHTYAETKAVEASGALSVASQFLKDKIESNQYLLSELGDLKNEADTFSTETFNEGFIAGRQLLAQGIINRLVPAMIKLLIANKDWYLARHMIKLPGWTVNVNKVPFSGGALTLAATP